MAHVIYIYIYHVFYMNMYTFTYRYNSYGADWDPIYIFGSGPKGHRLIPLAMGLDGGCAVQTPVKISKSCKLKDIDDTPVKVIGSKRFSAPAPSSKSVLKDKLKGGPSTVTRLSPKKMSLVELASHELKPINNSSRPLSKRQLIHGWW